MLAPNGDLYFSERATAFSGIRRWSAITGNTYSIIGGLPTNVSSPDGPAANTTFDSPFSLALSPDGTTIFYCDSGTFVVRKLVREVALIGLPYN